MADPSRPGPSFLARIERRLSRYAIRGLIHVIVLGNALFLALRLGNPGSAVAFDLDGEAIARGEVWRLVTHLFLPPHLDPLFLFFYLWLLWVYGRALEEAWGALRFNLYYLVGAVACTISGLVLGKPDLPAAALLNVSLFLAFATVYPDYTFYLFFILPVAARWLGWITAGFLGWNLVSGDYATRVLAGATVANYLLFFAPAFFSRLRDRARTQAWKQSVEAGRPDGAFHRCEVCGKTEKDDPQLEFRVCPDCKAPLDYCLDHIFEHDHH